MLKAQIESYFARLSPLPLALTEKVRLTNSQLIPALAYRLITHSLSPDQLEKLQSFIAAGVASQSITRHAMSSWITPYLPTPSWSLNFYALQKPPPNRQRHRTTHAREGSADIVISLLCRYSTTLKRNLSSSRAATTPHKH